MMSENIQLRKIASEFAEGEIDQDEYIRRTLDELVFQHSTSFWCRVMDARRVNDVNYR